MRPATPHRAKTWMQAAPAASGWRARARPGSRPHAQTVQPGGRRPDPLPQVGTILPRPGTAECAIQVREGIRTGQHGASGAPAWPGPSQRVREPVDGENLDHGLVPQTVVPHRMLERPPDLPEHARQPASGLDWQDHAERQGREPDREGHVNGRVREQQGTERLCIGRRQEDGEVEQRGRAKPFGDRMPRRQRKEEGAGSCRSLLRRPGHHVGGGCRSGEDLIAGLPRRLRR